MWLWTALRISGGLGLMVLLVIQADFRAVLSAASQVGWAALAVVAVRAAVVGLAGFGWAPLVTARHQAGLIVLVGLRFVRRR